MVSIKRLGSFPYVSKLTTVPLNEVAIKAKPLDHYYINQKGNFVTDMFFEYAKSLVGPFEKYAVLKKNFRMED